MEFLYTQATSFTCFPLLTPSRSAAFLEVEFLIGKDWYGFRDRGYLEIFTMYFHFLVSVGARIRKKVSDCEEMYHRETIYTLVMSMGLSNISCILIIFSLQRYLKVNNSNLNDNL